MSNYRNIFESIKKNFVLINRFLRIILLQDLYKDIPESDLISRQRFIIFRIFTAFGIIVSIAIAYQTTEILGYSGWLDKLLLLLALIFSVNYFALNYHKNKNITYAVMALSAFAVLHFLTYFSGGIRNAGMFYLGAIILATFMLLGNRAGKFFTVLSIIHLFYFYYLTENTTLVSNILVGDSNDLIDLDFLITGVLGTLVIAAQSNSLESSKNIVIQRVNASRKELQVKNRELEKLSLVASQTDNSVIIKNKEGVIEWVNDGFTRLMGYTLPEVVGRKSEEFLYGPLTDLKVIDEMKIQLSEKHTYSGEIIKYNNQGKPIWIHGTVNPIVSAEGNVTRYVFIESDISERKEAEKRMAEYMEDLEITNKELDKFAYIVSHDLKAPLRAIGNLSCWIEEDIGQDCSPELLQHFKLIKGRVARMESLINGILEYSRVNRRKSPEEVIDVKVLLNDITEFITENSELELSIDDNLPLVCADKIKLQQVFTNLISNAIKYNDKDKPWVKIACRDEENQWVFSVEDNGPGIEPQYHERIFVIFQTLQPRDVIESTGVGLAIVKKIVEEQGGRIWVESEKGKGAKFIFTIPKIKIEHKESPLVAATMIIKSNK